MDGIMYGEDQTWSMLSNFCTYLTSSLSSCGIPLPLPISDTDEDELSILYDRSPSPEPEFDSMSSRMGSPEQAWFTSQFEVQVQVQPQLRKREVMNASLDREEEEEDEDEENEADRRQSIMSEFRSGMDTPSPIPSPSLSQASSSNPFLTPPSPATPSPLNHTSPSSPPNHSSSNNAWQTAELNELKRVCSEEGCGLEIAKERISEDDYERIAKGMNNSYWWQMEIPTVRKPREYTGENVVGGVEVLRD